MNQVDAFPAPGAPAAPRRPLTLEVKTKSGEWLVLKKGMGVGEAYHFLKVALETYPEARICHKDVILETRHASVG